MVRRQSVIPRTLSAAPLSAQDALALLGSTLGEDDRAGMEATLTAAERTFGLAGVKVDEASGVGAFLLLTDGMHVPAKHPLAHSGLDPDVAGLLKVEMVSHHHDVVVGKAMMVRLAEALRERCRAVEAQAAPTAKLATASSPSPLWLSKIGFRPTVFPQRRFRYDLSSTVPWTKRGVEWIAGPLIRLRAVTAARVAKDETISVGPTVRVTGPAAEGRRGLAARLRRLLPLVGDKVVR